MKNTNHLFKYFDLAVNVCSTINMYYLSPCNAKMDLIDLNIYGPENLVIIIFGNPLENIFSILSTPWNHRNNIVFIKYHPNPVIVIEQS